MSCPFCIVSTHGHHGYQLTIQQKLYHDFETASLVKHLLTNFGPVCRSAECGVFQYGAFYKIGARFVLQVREDS